MTKLFQDAVDTARHLPPEVQDDIARVVMLMASQSEPIIEMSKAEQESFAVSRAQSARGEFASEERMRAIWSKDL